MNLDKYPEMSPETKQLICDLKQAFDECWEAKIATYDKAKKHAPLCLRIMAELLGDVPKLINNRIEERKRALDGLGVFRPDFWANEDMIIALWEHIESKFDLLEDCHASTKGA